MHHQISFSSANIAIAVSVLLACVGAGYTLGNSDRDDTISNLNLTIKAYEKANDLQLKDLIESIDDTSKELKLNISDQRELSELRQSFEKLKKQKQVDDENHLAEIEQLRVKIDSTEKALTESQKRYSNILPVIEEKLSFKKNVPYTRDTSIEVIPNLFYLGVSHIFSSSVVLQDDGNRVEIQMGQTKIFNRHGTVCHVRLMSTSGAGDEAVFDYGCTVKS